MSDSAQVEFQKPVVAKPEVAVPPIQSPTTPSEIHHDAATNIANHLTQAGHPTTAEQVAGTEAEVHLKNIRREVPGADVIGDIAHDASRFISSMTEGSGYVDIAKPDAKGNATVIKRFWAKAKEAGRNTKKGLFSFTLKGKNS